MPTLLMMYVLAFLDRSNVSFAKMGLAADAGVGETAFAFGASIFFLGYAFLEVPSNLILHRVGARIWLARIMVTWGHGVGGLRFRARRRLNFMPCAFCWASPRPASFPA